MHLILIEHWLEGGNCHRHGYCAHRRDQGAIGLRGHAEQVGIAHPIGFVGALPATMPVVRVAMLATDAGVERAQSRPWFRFYTPGMLKEILAIIEIVLKTSLLYSRGRLLKSIARGGEDRP